MKRAAFALFSLLLVPAALQAQITLENTAPTGLQSLLSLTAGHKLITTFNGGSTLTVYNLDLTPYRTLTVPAAPAGYTWSSASYFTQALFDTDSTTIEFMLLGFNENSGENATSIVKEDGTVLLTVAPGACFHFAGTLNEGPGIFETAQGAKMLIRATYGGPTQIYGLPGHVPCVASCLNGAIDPGFVGVGEQLSPQSGSSAFPNPAGERTTITYSLPVGDMQARLLLHDASGRVVLERRVGPSGRYVLETGQLVNGTYQFMIVGNSGVITGSKIVVVHQ